MKLIVSSFGIRKSFHEVIIRNYLQTLIGSRVIYVEPRFELLKDDDNSYHLSHVLAYENLEEDDEDKEYSGYPELHIRNDLAFVKVYKKICNSDDWRTVRKGDTIVYIGFRPQDLDMSDCKDDSEAIYKTMKFLFDSTLEMCCSLKELLETE